MCGTVKFLCVEHASRFLTLPETPGTIIPRDAHYLEGGAEMEEVMERVMVEEELEE